MRPIEKSLENQIVDLYERGVAGTTIFKRLGVPRTTVYRVLRRRGIQIDHENIRRKRLKFDAATAESIVSEYKAGVGSKELAAKYQCSTWCVREVVRRSGKGVRKRGASVREVSPEMVAEMAKLYESGESQAAIGRAFGIHQTTASHILRRYGVEPKWRVAEGERHGSWKGGRPTSSEGYIMVLLPATDPLRCMAAKSGYVMEHRLVMARHLGRPLTPNESVHHKDGDKTNNELDNLQLRVGNHGNGKTMRCRACGSHDIECIELD